MSGTVGDVGGHVQIADAASEANENDQPIMGWVIDVQDESRTYNSTYYGNSSTYTTTQSVIKTNGAPGTVRMGIIMPFITIVRAPIFNAAYGTALTECVVTSANAAGTTITHANDTVTDIDSTIGYGATAYCRSGANRGLYRLITTAGTNENVVSIPFPNTIAVGDKFIICSFALGYAALDIPSTANCIDGNNNLDHYYNVFCTKLDLSESGREYAEFMFHPKACGIAL